MATEVYVILAADEQPYQNPPLQTVRAAVVAAAEQQGYRVVAYGTRPV